MVSLRCCLVLLVAACFAEALPSANTCADGACDGSYDGKYVSGELDHMAAADTSVQLLQRWANNLTADDVDQTKLPAYATDVHSSGIPATCRPTLVAANKKCAKPKNAQGKQSWHTKLGLIKQAPDVWGWTAKGNPKAENLDETFYSQGIVGAWALAARGGECCNPRFEVYSDDGGQRWRVQCVSRQAMDWAGDLCDEFEDAPGHFVYDAANPSCGIADLSPALNPGKCTIGVDQIKEGCKPTLVKKGYQCSGPDTNGNPGNGRVGLGTGTSPEDCVRKWAGSKNCCGMRIDFDEGRQMCNCADYGPLYNWWCQDEFFEQNNGVDVGGGPINSDVYDISHCVNPLLHDCPVDPGEYTDDPCEKLVSVTLNTPRYSNLGGKGPDFDKEGILFPDAADVDGESVDLKVVSPDFEAFKPEKNGAKNGLGTFSMMTGASADLTFSLVTKNGEGVKIDGLAITFLDLDEGKNGQARTTVSSCGAEALSVGSELKTSDADNCHAASSAKHGTGKNNPKSLDGLTEEHKSRAATFRFGPGSEFKVTLRTSPGHHGRNTKFVVTPVLGCL